MKIMAKSTQSYFNRIELFRSKTADRLSNFGLKLELCPKIQRKIQHYQLAQPHAPLLVARFPDDRIRGSFQYDMGHECDTAAYPIGHERWEHPLLADLQFVRR